MSKYTLEQLKELNKVSKQLKLKPKPCIRSKAWYDEIYNHL